MSERLTRRLVDVDGGRTRVALIASIAIVAAAFAFAFAIARGSIDAQPPAASRTALRGAASHQTAFRSAELRPVALPAHSDG